LTRRQELQLRCDMLYEIICLVVALSVFGTNRSHEDIDKAVAKIGFATRVDAIPILDWDAVGVVTLSTFILLLFFNGIYSIVGYVFSLFVIYPEIAPDRVSIIRFSVLFTLGYAIVIWLAVRLKRSWRLKGITDNRPENLLIGIFCYLTTVWINIIISLYIRHELTYAPCPIFVRPKSSHIGIFHWSIYRQESVEATAICQICSTASSSASNGSNHCDDLFSKYIFNKRFTEREDKHISDQSFHWRIFDGSIGDKRLYSLNYVPVFL